MKFKFLCTLLFCALHISGFPGEDFTAREHKVMESFRKGDYFGLYENIEALLFDHPFRPEAFLYYYDIARMADVLGRQRAEATLDALLSRLDETPEVANANIIRLNLTLEKEKVISPRDTKGAAKLGEMLGPLRKWVVFGPYKKYGPGDLYHPFPPEGALSLKTRVSAGRTIDIDNPGGILKFGRYIYPAEGIAYAATSFRISGEVKVRVYSGAEYALFINGRHVLTNGGGDTSRLCRVIRIQGTDEVTLMLKIRKLRSWDARVIVTDVEDRVLRPVLELDRFYRSGFRHVEEPDHPFAAFMALEDQGRKAFALASFFDELESDESIELYRKAAESRKDAMSAYFLASALLGYSGNDAASARFLEGWRMMGEAARDPGLVPALHRRFRKIYDSRDYLKALEYGKSKYGKMRNYFPFRRDYLRLMRLMGYRKEFEEESEKLRADFPSSIFSFQEEAEYWEKHEPLKAASIYEELLKKTYDRKSLKALVNLYRRRSMNREALGAIEKYGLPGDLSRDRVSLLVDLGEYEAAKDLAFKKLLEREDPYYYLQLGYIDQLRGDDPLMHWKRYLSLKPSYFTLNEYGTFLEKGAPAVPLGDINGAGALAAVERWKKSESAAGASSSVLYRGRVYELLRDGGSRVHCEEVIALEDRKGIEKWGEYRVPYRGSFTPVRVRVHRSDGGYTESYGVQDVDGTKYINLPSLEEHSLVHLEYYVENPVGGPAYSSFFCTPRTEIANYDEPLEKFHFTLLAPPEMRVNVRAPEGAKVREGQRDGMKSYSFSVENVPAITRESYVGSKFRVLPWYAFSTMESIGDFATWYRGRLGGLLDADSDFCRRQFSGRGEALVHEVYEYVARKVDLDGTYLYYPKKASDVLYRKSGTAEDRVVLAKSILARLGMISFIAFARRMEQPDIGGTVLPESFTDILLFVPITTERGLWLDFSSMEYACGDVSPGLDDTEALVLHTGGHEYRRIKGGKDAEVTGRYHVTLTREGNAEIEGSLEFSGTLGEFRKNFKNAWEQEKGARIYFSSLIPSLELEKFTVERLEEHRKPFKITMTGGAFGLGTPGRKRLLFRTSLVASNAYKYIRYSSRHHALVVREDLMEDDIYEYRLPEGTASVSAPEDFSLGGRFGYAEIKIRCAGTSGPITVMKKIHLKKGVISPHDYGEFMDFCMKIKDAEYKNITAGL